MLDDGTTTIIVSLITLVGVFATGVLGYFTNRHARGINDAVNNRHKKKRVNGDLPPKIYDLVIDNDMRTTRVEAKVDDIVSWKSQVEKNRCKFQECKRGDEG